MDKYYEIIEESVLGKYVKEGYQSLIYHNNQVQVGTSPFHKDYVTVEEHINEEDIISIIHSLKPNASLSDGMEPLHIDSDYIASVTSQEEGKVSLFLFFPYNIHTVRARRLSTN